MEHDGTWLWSSREWMGLELGPTGLDGWNAAFDGWKRLGNWWPALMGGPRLRSALPHINPLYCPKVESGSLKGFPMGVFFLEILSQVTWATWTQESL